MMTSFRLNSPKIFRFVKFYIKLKTSGEFRQSLTKNDSRTEILPQSTDSRYIIFTEFIYSQDFSSEEVQGEIHGFFVTFCNGLY
jgi:hypothetical protein